MKYAVSSTLLARKEHLNLLLHSRTERQAYGSVDGYHVRQLSDKEPSIKVRMKMKDIK